MILIIGTADDEHVRYVAGRLEERGSTYVQFDPRHYPARAELTVEYDQAGRSRGSLTLPGEHVDLGDVRAAWHRARVRPVPASIVREDQSWWVAESCARFLSQLYEWLDCYWVPEHPTSHRDAVHLTDAEAPPYDAWAGLPARAQTPSPENKLHQLSVAGRLGLAVPRTLMTNSPERFLDFYENCRGELISKRAVNLAPRVGGDLTRPFTASVQRRDAANHQAVRHAPVLFQEKVQKRLELRVTVVGPHVFAAEIRSQDSYRQQTDWRHYPEYGQSQYYAIHTLPSEVEQQCVQLVKALNLSFGALDLILTPDDRYVFLEVNINGQWAYLETMLGLPISNAIAELLTSADK
jgi:MvdD-like protein with pre-ATP grasp domain/ribosomal protein S6-L-glutamate ligase RimK-like protein